MPPLVRRPPRKVGGRLQKVPGNLAAVDPAKVAAAQQGDALALDQLLDELAPYVRRLCARIAPAAADDATQESLLATFRGLPRCHGGWHQVVADAFAHAGAQPGAGGKVGALGGVSHHDLARIASGSAARLSSTRSGGVIARSMSAVLVVPVSTRMASRPARLAPAMSVIRWSPITAIRAHPASISRAMSKMIFSGL